MMDPPDLSPHNPSSPLPPARSLLARAAYWLACAGPLSFFLVLGFTSRNPHVMPGFSQQPVWWILRMASPFGILLGTFALIEIRFRKHLIGFNLAVAAIVVGLICSIFTAIWSIYLMNDVARYRHRGKLSCMSNLKYLGLGVAMYTQDYDDCYPLAANWNEATYPYVKNDAIFRCPGEDEDKVPSYALNRNLQVLPVANIPDPAAMVLLFDSKPGRDLAGTMELLPYPLRHIESSDDNIVEGANICFSDGHVKFRTVPEIYNSVWQPVLKPRPNPAKKTQKKKTK